MSTPASVTSTASGGASTAAVTLRDVSKVYGTGAASVRALDDVSLTVARGEFTCLIGASGCGKSTLLSLVAGLERPTGGTIGVGGGVALMFQEAALFPLLQAAGNGERARLVWPAPPSVGAGVRRGRRPPLHTSRAGRGLEVCPVTVGRPRRIASAPVAELAATITDRLREEVSRHGHH